MEVVSVRPIFKKDDRTNTKYYRSVILLIFFVKLYEKFLNEQLLHFLNHFMSAYRKGYNANHVLIQLIKHWRKALDTNIFTRTVLMGLSNLPNTFDCIPDDLLIVKLHADSLGFNTATFLFAHLKEWKQKVSVSNIFSLFKIILSGLSQGSILGPIWSILWLKNSDLLNFVDDNTIAVIYNNLTSLCQTLEKESGSDYFKNNSMTANFDKFLAIILSKNVTDVTHKLIIYDNKIETTKSVKLLGVKNWLWN